MHEYFIIPDIEAIPKEKDPEKLKVHRRRIAVNIGDPDAMRAVLGISSDDFHDFYGDSELPQLSTEDTIDSFLEKFGKEDLPDVPVMPALDYVAMLEAEEGAEAGAEDAPKDNTLGAIDAFLKDVPPARVKPKKPLKPEEKPSLTESFAKIMIKNGNYRRALEIISEISLNNPEKSIYFADQMRFLRKLILLEAKNQPSPEAYQGHTEQ